MAATKTLLTASVKCLQIIHPCNKFVQIKCMSMFPSYYIKPIFKRELQEELEKSGEIQKLAHVPIKPPLNDETSSKSYDELANKLINYCTKDGNKVVARSLLEQAFENVKRIQLEKYHKCTKEEEKSKIELNPRVILAQAVENGRPLLQLTGIKRGGVKYQVPVPITERRSRFLSMQWLIEAAKEKGKSDRFYLQLAKEMINTANNTGKVIKKKTELHKQCEANRAYAHYRWS